MSTYSSEDGSITRIREAEFSNSESDLSNIVPQSSASGRRGCGWGLVLQVGVAVGGA